MPSDRRLVSWLAIGAVCAVLVAPVAAAGPAKDVRPQQVDRAENCNETAPESVKVWTGSGENVILSVLVLLDGATKIQAHEIITSAAGSYRPLNITIEPTYKKVTFGDGITRAEQLISDARVLSNGVRPAGVDLVYILTSRDISIASGDVVGYSDCIGGIRYPNRAFAIGESVEEPLTTGGLNLYADGPAKTAAHEMGHLLGARHENANCAQGAGADDVSNREPTVCTLMTNYLDFQSSEFGSLESFIVRSYAEKYAAP